MECCPNKELDFIKVCMHRVLCEGEEDGNKKMG
jgi:hypothetical protein